MPGCGLAVTCLPPPLPADNGAVLFSALRLTAWAQHARLVPVTGEGLALSGLNQALWQPLSRMLVDSWAEFSSRLRDGEVRQAACCGGRCTMGSPAAGRCTPAKLRLDHPCPAATVSPAAQEDGPPPADGAPPPSYEGGDQRCFRRLFVCTQDVRLAMVYPKDGGTPQPLQFRWVVAVGWEPCCWRATAAGSAGGCRRGVPRPALTPRLPVRPHCAQLVRVRSAHCAPLQPAAAAAAAGRGRRRGPADAAAGGGGASALGAQRVGAAPAGQGLGGVA